ncbi:MAG: hypothetical protein H0U74_11180 [Bradymonadaceae bacterium]|nr:hypothetical protein [Lujinxingiaceae bacterium]
MVSVGCGELDAPVQDDIAWMQAHTTHYLENTAWRRAELEASLWRAELPYARKRLAGYALADGGWDLLPELQSLSGLVFSEGASAQLGPLVEFSTTVPTTRQGWLELGEAVFWRMPMRRDNYLEWLVERPELVDAVGIARNDDGSLRGVVSFKDARGEQRVGATCGMCHGQDGVAGLASSSLDLGLGRALYNETHGRPGDVYAAWGAGRVDVTDDTEADPLAIPNLWGAKYQSYLNASAAVRVASPASLAVRFETQYIVGHGLEARPNRVLVWALAMYVLSLEPPAPTSSPAAQAAVGAAIFDAACATCHYPNAGYSGDLIDAGLLVGQSPAAYSPLRGTGMLKVPSLIGVGAGGPYFHDGRHATLQSLLQDNHPFGAPLSGADQDALEAFLNTL